MDINHPLPDQSIPLRNSNGGGERKCVRACVCMSVCVDDCAREGKSRQSRKWQEGEIE